MHEYLSKHIREEIDGAMDYLTKALELKKTHPEIASKFYRMSEMEVEHANCMTKMFNSIEKPEDLAEESYSAMLKSVLDSYTQSMSKIEHMKKLYWE